MNKKQIRRDYENVDYLDEKGRVRTKVRYRGALYALEEPDQMTAFRVLYVLFAAISVPLFVLPLCFDTDVLRTIYFTLPYVAEIFCVFMMVMGAYNVLVRPFPYREEVFSLVFSRAKVSAVACGVLSLVSVATFSVYAGLNGAKGLDYLALGCALSQLAVDVAFVLNVRARKINRIAPPEPSQDEPVSPAAPETAAEASAPAPSAEGEERPSAEAPTPPSTDDDAI